jgi:hypothetical protein
MDYEGMAERFTLSEREVEVVRLVSGNKGISLFRSSDYSSMPNFFWLNRF